MNGHLVRDSTGRATGMLHEEAINWASEFLPRTTEKTLSAGLLAGQSYADRHGITGVITRASKRITSPSMPQRQREASCPFGWPGPVLCGPTTAPKLPSPG